MNTEDRETKGEFIDAMMKHDDLVYSSVLGDRYESDIA
jgi:hypothetical protein